MKLKINSKIENVVIGSRTLPEYKFQILNFMNMFYDNILHPEKEYGMTVGVVSHNLCQYIKKVYDMSGLNYYDIDRLYKQVHAIEINVKFLESACRLKDDKTVKRSTKVYIQNIQTQCSLIWEALLEDLRKVFKLEYDLTRY